MFEHDGITHLYSVACKGGGGKGAFLLSSFDIGDEQGRERLKKACSDFAICYENDVTVIQLYDKIVNFVMLIQADESTVPSDPNEVLKALVKFGKDIFPTVCIAYRLLLTIAS